MPLNVNFIYSYTQGGELIEYNPDDGTETILQTGLQTYGDLAVTQDGVLLGFGFVGGIRGQIFTIDPDTGAETLLLETGQSGGAGSGAASALGLDQFDNIYYSTNNNTEIQ